MVDPPVFEHISAVSNDSSGLHPVVPELLDAIHGHGVQRGSGAKIQKERRRILQCHLEGVVIKGVHAHLREVRDLSLGKSLGVLHVEKLVVVACRGLRREGSLPRFHEVARSDWPAIAPFRILPDFEGVDLSVRRDCPRFCRSGTGFAEGIEGREPLEESVDDAALRLTRDDRGIEGLGLRPVDEDQIGPFLCGSATAQRKQNKEADESKVHDHQ